MRSIRRLVSSAALAVTLFGLMPQMSFALVFKDVYSTTPYAKAIEALKDRAVLEGYSDGTFRPAATVNRAEFLKIVLGSRGGTFAGGNCFPDVGTEWFAPYVCTAKQEDIVGGYPDGTFRPDQTINFVEASKILSLAFKQQAQETGSEWYDPYVRALDSSKAIPPSIKGMDRMLTRGEMAEMMWRLTEGVTNQPSLGYMNVKYPALKVNVAADTPQQAKSCADLQAFAQEAKTSGGYYGELMRKQGIMPTPSMAPTGANEAKAMDTSYSQTNVQVEGVDESDIVKTDGTYLYIMEGQQVRIVKALPPGQMTIASTIDLSDSVYSPSELYLDGNRLIVLGSGYREPPYRIMQNVMPSLYPYQPSVQRTQVKVYDIADRSHPVLDRTVEFDGSLTSSRRINDRLYLVMNQNLPWVYDPKPVPLESDVLPQFKDSAIGTSDQSVTRCANVIILPPVPRPQYLIVAVVPTRSATAEVKKEVILGSADTVYASTENLYVASGEWQYGWRGGLGTSEEKTHLYRFAFTSDGVAFKAQGSVPGHILNQFSMDEHEQSFRIATTKGQVWDSSSPSTSNLYVLNFDLEQVGALEGIAPGEQIYSVRFLGDRTYMVTFKKTDPFFVIDTSDPRNPKILGKLKIPGYSDYLHPFDATHIIGFGKEATDSKDGNFAWYQGMKIALFDVSDPADPKEMSKVTIGDRGTSSPLLQNHKALLFEADRHLMAFPVSVAKVSEVQKAEGSWDFPAYGETVFQGAYVYTIDLKSGITLRGTVTHYTADDLLKSGSYFYGKSVERIVRIGDSLFTIGQDGVKSVSEATVQEEGKLNF